MARFGVLTTGLHGLGGVRTMYCLGVILSQSLVRSIRKYSSNSLAFCNRGAIVEEVDLSGGGTRRTTIAAFWESPMGAVFLV